MDLVDIIEEKKFIGQEFLVWLWRMGELAGGVAIDSGQHVGVEIGNAITLESNTEPVERVTCSGDDMCEAIVALKEGKKPTQAQFKLTHGDNEYDCTIIAETLELRGVSVPKTAATETQDDAEGMVLERISLFEHVASLVDSLFQRFIASRLSADGWSNVLSDISGWIEEQTA